MTIAKTPWTYESWADVERLGNALASLTFELNEHVGSGGAAVSGDDIRASIRQLEAVLSNLKQTVSNYN